MIVKTDNPKYYKITMPDGKEITFWFAGKQFEEVLKAYKIPYKKSNKKYGGYKYE